MINGFFGKVVPVTKLPNAPRSKLNIRMTTRPPQTFEHEIDEVFSMFMELRDEDDVLLSQVLNNLHALVTRLDNYDTRRPPSQEYISPDAAELLQEQEAVLPLIEQQRLLERCNDMRLRTVAVALACSQGTKKNLKDILDNEHASAVGAITEYPDGVKVGNVFDDFAILLPAMNSRAQSWNVLNCLTELYLSLTGSADWIIDFSSVKEADLLLLSSLLGYEREFKKQGREIGLVWLHESSIPPTLRKKLIQCFSLRKIGQFYFSTHMALSA